MEWQTMETAPRDGRSLLFALSEEIDMPVRYGPAVKTRVICGDLIGPTNELIDAFGRIVTVTHWMPLPPPPQAPE